MRREAQGAEPEDPSNAAATDGVVTLRRRSDWTGEPREADEAAESAYRAALDVATATLAAYDGETASHSDDVVTLSLAIAEELGVEGRQLTYLLAAAELHDIGKVAVPSEILQKPTPLDTGEWQTVRRHTVTGQEILTAVPEMTEVAHIVRHCHERWDGRGYPDGLEADAIPLASRVVFCADAFHAIRGDRPYRRGRSADRALAEVRAHCGTQFDPAVVAALGAVAERMRERRRLGLAWRGTGPRSQRLAALLLALVVGGSAYASTGGFHGWPRLGRADTEPARAAPAPPRERSFAPALADRAGPAAKKKRKAKRDAAGGAAQAPPSVPVAAPPQPAPSTTPYPAAQATAPAEGEPLEEDPVEEDVSFEGELTPDEQDPDGEEVSDEVDEPAEDEAVEDEAPVEEAPPVEDEAPLPEEGLADESLGEG